MISDIEDLRKRYIAGEDLRPVLTTLFQARSAGTGGVTSLKTAEMILYSRSSESSILREDDVNEDSIEAVKFDLNLLRSLFSTIPKNIIPELTLPKDLLQWLYSVLLCKSDLIDANRRGVALYVTSSIFKNFETIPSNDIEAFGKVLLSCISESNILLTLFLNAQSNENPNFTPGAVMLAQSVDSLLAVNLDSLSITPASESGLLKFITQLIACIPISISLLDITSKIKIANCFVNASKLYSVLAEMIVMSSAKISSDIFKSISSPLNINLHSNVVSVAESVSSAILSISTLHDGYLLCFQTAMELSALSLRMTGDIDGADISSNRNQVLNEIRASCIRIVSSRMEAFLRTLTATTTDGADNSELEGDKNKKTDEISASSSVSGGSTTSAMALRRIEMLLNCAQSLYQDPNPPPSGGGGGESTPMSPPSATSWARRVGILNENTDDVTVLLDIVERLNYSLRTMLTNVKAPLESKISASGQSGLGDLRIVCGDIRKASILLVDEVLLSSPSWILCNLDAFWSLASKVLSSPLIFNTFFKAIYIYLNSTEVIEVESSKVIDMAEKIMTHLVGATRNCTKYSAQAAFDILQAINDIYSCIPPDIDVILHQGKSKCADVLSVLQLLHRRIPDILSEIIIAYRKEPKFKSKPSSKSKKQSQGSNDDDEENLNPMSWRNTLLAVLEATLQFHSTLSNYPSKRHQLVGPESTEEPVSAESTASNSIKTDELVQFLCGEIEVLHKLQGRSSGPKGLGAVGVNISSQFDALGYGGGADDEVLSGLLLRHSISLNALLVILANDFRALSLISKENLNKIFLLHQSIINRKVKFQDDEEQICIEIQSVALIGYVIWRCDTYQKEILDATVRSIFKVLNIESQDKVVLNFAAKESLSTLQNYVESSKKYLDSHDNNDNKSKALDKDESSQSLLLSLLSAPRKDELKKALTITM